MDGGRRNIEREADRGRAEHAGAVVVDRSMDWKASLVNHAWSILWIAMYQASGSVSVCGSSKQHGSDLALDT